MKKIFCLFLTAVLTVAVFCGCTAILPRSTSSVNKNANEASSAEKKLLLISGMQNSALTKSYDSVFNTKTTQSFTAQLSDGRLWLPTRINDDIIYGSTAAINGKCSKIITRDVKTKKTEEVCSLQKDYEPEFICYNNEYIAWTEYIPYYEQKGQRVVLYNRATKVSKVLDDTKCVEAGDIRIAIGNDCLLWSYSTITDGKADYNTYSFDFKTSKTGVFQKSAYNPVCGNGFIAWIGPSPTQKDNAALYYKDTETNSITVLSSDYGPLYLAASGDNLVACGMFNADPADIKMANVEYLIVLYNKGKPTLIERSKKLFYEFPVVCNNYVSWDENEKKRVYSIKTNTIIEFPGEYGYVNVSDKYLMWGSETIPGENVEEAAKDGMYKTDMHVISTGA